MPLQKIILVCLRDDARGKPVTMQHLLKLVDKTACFRYTECEIKDAMWLLIAKQQLSLTPDRKIKFERMF